MSNKKIGILTFHRAENYGAILQSYSLFSTLNLIKNLDVFLIDYRSNELEKPYRLIYFGNDNKIIYNFLKSIALLWKNIIKKKNFNSFRRNNMLLTKSIYDKKSFYNLLNEFDYVITGSDQVWNLDITKDDKDIYLLNDLKRDNQYKKISYAASIGSDLKNEEYYKIISNAINDYKSVSVREELAKKYLEEYTNKNIKVCIDPVLLQKEAFWKKVSRKSNITKKYLFVYTIDLDDKMINYANKLAKDKELLIVHVDKKGRYKEKSKSMYQCGPDIFLDLICNAEYVLTNSFHGLAFSIIFKKQFVVFPKKGRNSRIENLLNLCGLEQRNYNSNINIDDKIDYVVVNKKMDKYIDESIKFLEESIDMEKNNEK